MSFGQARVECCIEFENFHHRPQPPHHSEKYCVHIMACKNLGICHSVRQRWNVALSFSNPSTSHSNTITSEKNCVICACRNLGICDTVLQRWHVALSVIVVCASNSFPMGRIHHLGIPTSPSRGFTLPLSSTMLASYLTAAK